MNRGIVGVLMVSLLVLGGCSGGAQTGTAAHATVSTEGPMAGKSAINVVVSTATLSDFSEQVSVSGQTIADKDVTYAAEVPGRLESLKVDLGDRVRVGQILARVDYKTLKARADQAQASYDISKKTYERLEILLKDELITQQGVDEARAQLDQATALLETARLTLEQSSIQSTVNGTVVQKFVESGEYVGPGIPVVRVVDYSTIIVEAQLPELIAPRVKQNSPVVVNIDALGQDFEGTVDVVVPTSDMASKTFLLRVNVKNRDHRILVGMAASLELTIATYSDVIVVPQDVIIEESTPRSVFIEKDGVAHRRVVQLGAPGQATVLVTSGIQPGDRLIVMGHRELVDGQPVVMTGTTDKAPDKAASAPEVSDSEVPTSS